MAHLSDDALRELLDLGFDHACQRPLSDFVDPARVLAALDASCDVAKVERWQTRVWKPLRERLIDRAQASTLTLGAWLPDEATTAIAEMLAAPAPIPRKVIDELVASEQVRDNIRTTLQDSLTNFIQRATAPAGASGAGAGGGIRDALGWGARKVAAAGRGILSGMSEELQRQLQDRVRDFVDGSVAVVQSRIAEKLASEDTARALGRRRRKAFLSVLRRTEAEVARGARRAPHDRIDPLVPKVVAHNLAREEVRAAIRDEVAAVLAELSTQPLGALLDEAGLREAARGALHAHGLAFARALVAGDAFGQWWARHAGGA